VCFLLRPAKSVAATTMSVCSTAITSGGEPWQIAQWAGSAA
jgi:hypothetical protein